MECLPIEIINIILEYQGYHTYRNGKYMNRLYIGYEHKKLLSSIPRIIKNKYGTYEICFWKTIYIDQLDNTPKSMTCPLQPLISKYFIKSVPTKYICFMIETIVLDSQVLWILNTIKCYDSNSSYDDRDRIQFILNS